MHVAHTSAFHTPVTPILRYFAVVFKEEGQVTRAFLDTPPGIPFSVVGCPEYCKVFDLVVCPTNLIYFLWGYFCVYLLLVGHLYVLEEAVFCHVLVNPVVLLVLIGKIRVEQG
jgi:hypothetical protein